MTSAKTQPTQIHTPSAAGRRPTSITCGWCGIEVTVRPVGRLPSWCSTSCRHRAWEHRRAAASGRAAVEIVERIVEIEVPVTVPETVEVVVPPKGAAWVEALHQLARQVDIGMVYDRDLPAVAEQLNRVSAAVRRRRQRRRHGVVHITPPRS
jgi:hypothetical protein